MKFDENCHKTIEVPKHGSTFIYYLLKDGEVVYVGQTRKGLSRPFMHDGEKDFDEVKIIECELHELNVLESIAIEKYQPKQNVAAGALNVSMSCARNRVREITGNTEIYLSDIKKAMKSLGIEPYLVDMTPRIHAADVLKIANYFGRL